jgi:hypothetical protein
MKKPTIRVTKWLGDIPVEAGCSVRPGVVFKAKGSGHRPSRAILELHPRITLTGSRPRSIVGRLALALSVPDFGPSVGYRKRSDQENQEARATCQNF